MTSAEKITQLKSKLVYVEKSWVRIFKERVLVGQQLAKIQDENDRLKDKVIKLRRRVNELKEDLR